ncbi:prepilin-type N-terminal cleavage/methylation domain-containing protein [Patescibacteria group bacterium]|nr:prepilin-type N-terminal cleavage/methylation domain-containing protein [Patescibacteria group bacterium]
MSITKKGSRGFTLIELLVVIAIIGLLSSVVLASLTAARARARDTRRVADLIQVRNALESYYSSNGAYPLPATHADGGWGGWDSECNGGGGLTSSNVIPGLVPSFMPSFPSDPSMNKTANTNCYLYYSNGTDYKFMAYNLTSGSDLSKFPALIDPPRNSGASWGIAGCQVDSAWALSVYSSGAKCAW